MPFSVSTDGSCLRQSGCRVGVGLCGAQLIAIAEFQVVRPIFVVAPNLIGADKTSRKWAESAVRSVLRCHKLCENRPRRRVFRSSLAELQMEKDSMAERTGFEPAVPLISRNSGRFLQICYLPRRATAYVDSSGCCETRLKAVKERNRRFESGPLRQPVPLSGDSPLKWLK